jgi:hypothetical protein
MKQICINKQLERLYEVIDEENKATIIDNIYTPSQKNKIEQYN